MPRETPIFLSLSLFLSSFFLLRFIFSLSLFLAESLAANGHLGSDPGHYLSLVRGPCTAPLLGAPHLQGTTVPHPFTQFPSQHPTKMETTENSSANLSYLYDLGLF
jgi:hypothetical protein